MQRNTLVVTAVLGLTSLVHAQWKQKQPANAPTARILPAMGYDAQRGEVVLFGGFDGAVSDETWVFDGQDWSRRFPTVTPPPRAG